MNHRSLILIMGIIMVPTASAYNVLTIDTDKKEYRPGELAMIQVSATSSVTGAGTTVTYRVDAKCHGNATILNGADVTQKDSPRAGVGQIWFRIPDAQKPGPCYAVVSTASASEVAQSAFRVGVANASESLAAARAINACVQNRTGACATYTGLLGAVRAGNSCVQNRTTPCGIYTGLLGAVNSGNSCTQNRTAPCSIYTGLLGAIDAASSCILNLTAPGGASCGVLSAAQFLEAAIDAKGDSILGSVRYHSEQCLNLTGCSGRVWSFASRTLSQSTNVTACSGNCEGFFTPRDIWTYYNRTLTWRDANATQSFGGAPTAQENARAVWTWVSEPMSESRTLTNGTNLTSTMTSAIGLAALPNAIAVPIAIWALAMIGVAAAFFSQNPVAWFVGALLQLVSAGLALGPGAAYMDQPWRALHPALLLCLFALLSGRAYLGLGRGAHDGSIDA